MKVFSQGKQIQDTGSQQYRAQAENTLNLTTAQAKYEAELKKQLAEKDRAGNAQLAEKDKLVTTQQTELENQAKVNAAQTQLIQGYQTQEETSRKEGLVKNLMQGLSNQEHGIVTRALKAFSTGEAKPQNFITLSTNNDFDKGATSEHYKLNFSVSRLAEDLTEGSPLLAGKLAKVILDYNNLPATESKDKDGNPVYEFEQRRDSQRKNNFSTKNVEFKLPEFTEGAKLKGSPVISLDGAPYLNGAQQEAEIEQRKTLPEKIRGKLFSPVAGLLLSSGVGVVGFNSMSNNPVPGIPDLTPQNPQVLVQSKQSSVSTPDLSREELLKMRSEYFQKVEVKSGQGYTQLLQEYLSEDLKRNGIDKITLKNTELAFIVNLSQAMTNLDNSNNPNLNLQKLTNPNMINEIRDGITEVYIPKEGVLDRLINGYKIPPAPGPEDQNSRS
jgi:hypothetical protein